MAQTGYCVISKIEINLAQGLTFRRKSAKQAGITWYFFHSMGFVYY